MSESSEEIEREDFQEGDRVEMIPELQGANLFSPRFSLNRTPPKKTTERSIKKRKQANSPECVVSPRSGEPTSNYIQVINREVESILETTSRETGGKISFNRGDQVKVRGSLLKVQQVVVDLVYKMGVLEGKVGRGAMGNETEGAQRREETDNLLGKLESEVAISRKAEEAIMEMLKRQADTLEQMGRAMAEMKRGREGYTGETDQTAGETDRETAGESEAQTAEEGKGRKKGRRGDEKNREEKRVEMETEGSEGNEESETDKKKKPAKETYAEKSKKKGEMKKPWTTPPPMNKNKLEIQISKDKSRREAIEKMKEKLKIEEIGGPVRSIISLPSGDLMVSCIDEKQREIIRGRLKGDEMVRVREEREVKPTFMITGVDAGFTGEFVVKEIITQNQDIFAQYGNAAEEKLKVVTKRTCRDRRKENWLLEATPEVFKKIMRKQILAFDLMMVHVEEFIRPAICFRCCGYGHVGKYCTAEKPICYRCAGDHEGKNCQERELRCINCRKTGKEEKGHMARDQSCPVMKRKINRQRRLVNFEGCDDIPQHVLEIMEDGE